MIRFNQFLAILLGVWTPYIVTRCFEIAAEQRLGGGIGGEFFVPFFCLYAIHRLYTYKPRKRRKKHGV